MVAKEDTTELEEKVEQCLQLEPSKKKKKNKKKSSGAPITPLAPFYEEALQPYPVKLNNTKAKGRHAVAATKLDAGVVVCQEQASAFVVRSDYIDQQCHVCLSDLEQKLMCSDCKTTFYCSESCLHNDNDTHVLVCSAFAQVNAIGRATDVEPDMLRLMTLLMARKYLDQQTNEKVGPTPYWCVEDLLSHKENADPDFIRVMHEASQRLLMEMSEKIHIPVDDMVTLACRINSNAHGLGDNQARNTDVALGLFPLGALFFNHGCNPNTAFIGMPNGQLAFRTIRPVAKDDELVVSYIDLYATRDERRQELYTSKHFWCKCKRCAGPIDRSVDRFLQGIVCTQCQADVYVIPSTPMEHLIKGVRNVDTATGHFECPQCHHTTSCDTVRDVLYNANKSYMIGMAAFRQERNYKKGSDTLEHIIHDVGKGGQLHPLNAFRFNALIPLMNCKRHLGNVKGTIEVNKAILDLLQRYADEGSLPAYTSEVSDFWQNLGELCASVAKESRNAVLEKKWQKEANFAFNQSLHVRTIVFGKEHSKTKLIKDLIK